MKRMRRRAKPPSCSRGLLPLTATRFSSPSSAATLKRALREAQLEPDDNYRRFELALAHFARKDQAAADAALAELIAKSRDIAAYQIAEVYAFRGETDKAFEWLQISFDTHDTGMLGVLVDPLLRDLRTDPRYKALVAKMNFPAMP